MNDSQWLSSGDHVKALCDRRFGFGADGVIESFLGESGLPYMHLVNSDGSIAEMSGNGLRCLIHHLVRVGILEISSQSKVETMAGERRFQSLGYETQNTFISKVQMPKASAKDMEIEGFKGSFVDVGNPHFVILCDSKDHLESLNLLALGPRVEGSFGSGANVEWIYVESPRRVHLRVWERGAGETLACGTGSVASYITLLARDLPVSKVEVVNPGGSLWVQADEDEEILWLEGSSTYIGDVYEAS